MFCDQITIKIIAGKGGDGMLHFRREKFRERGGPDGGDGGHGGSIIFTIDSNLNTLASFLSRKIYNAEPGQNGAKNDKHGATGTDLFLAVPPGTIIYDENTGSVFMDMTDGNMQFVAAKGGRGGYGNAHFKASTRQSPAFAELGEPGEEKTLRLELRLVADVGIIGLPSVGKSTLISRISHARPKIADYPFTTLIPNLGVVNLQEFDPKERGKSFVVADIPGLIEGAHEGKGLGDEFLRHISRTRILVHMLDAGSASIAHDYEVIMNELRVYDESLVAEEQIVVINKSDLFDEETLNFLIAELETTHTSLSGKIRAISCATGKGIPELVFALWKRYLSLKRKENRKIVSEKEPVKIFRPHLEDTKYFEVQFVKKRKNGTQVFEIKGKRIEQLVTMTDFGNDAAIARVYDVMRKMGITEALFKAGAREGDDIKIAGQEIVFLA